uniref:Odorant receptor n=1 Tax=Colaphellus bowringi TaxID=561076 RepID=A0A0S3J3F6_9CUCU|nr:odorant receptor OR21 [Colaphellus bowringi]
MKTQFQKAFQKEKWILTSLGSYPQWEPEALWQHCRRFFCMTVSITYITLMCTGPLLENSIMILCTVMGVVKEMQLLFSKQQFREIEEYIGSMKPCKIPISRLLGSFRNSVVTVIIFLGLMPYTKRSLRMLPYKSWLPYDVSRAPVYYVTFVAEVLTIIMAAFTNTTIDVLYYCLIDICCAELDLLKMELMEIDMSESYEVVQNKLKNVVIYHQRIIRLVEVIQDVFSSVVFIQCMTSVLVICFLGFQIVYVDEIPSGKATIEVSFIGCMLLQIFSYCWFGQSIMMKSLEVADVCYNSNWYDADLRIRKMIFIIMERCKQPLELRAKIITINLQTLLAILRSSYSYMAILRTLYSD